MFWAALIDFHLSQYKKISMFWENCHSWSKIFIVVEDSRLIKNEVTFPLYHFLSDLYQTRWLACLYHKAFREERTLSLKQSTRWIPRQRITEAISLETHLSVIFLCSTAGNFIFTADGCKAAESCIFKTLFGPIHLLPLSLTKNLKLCFVDTRSRFARKKDWAV